MAEMTASERQGDKRLLVANGGLLDAYPPAAR
jgi:hypothetical protein